MLYKNGFTLIELVVVLVILGILAAFAIPRFYDFSNQSNIAILNGLAGALNSANVTSHGAALAQNQISSTGTISMEGTPITLMYGYPTGDGNGIGAAISYSSTSYSVTYSGGVATFTVNSAPTPASCFVTYTQPNTSGDTGVVSGITVIGC